MWRSRRRRLCRCLSSMKISLYIHIPFCVRKCLYCDFLSGPDTSRVRFSYVDALIREIGLYKNNADWEVISIFFGGGTPSILEEGLISKILSAVKGTFKLAKDCEITIEVNPGTANKARVIEYKEAGINRLSIGLQSANNEHLKTLGRIHTVEEFKTTYDEAVRAGFDNINVDLMSGIPGQTVDDHVKNLEYLLSLDPVPKHISSYGLIIEEGTPFYSMYGEDAKGKCEKKLPAEEEERKMYYITDDILTKAHFHRYEISNYALPGFESRHNKVYWERGNYLGLGLGSSSMVENVRWKNTEDMDEYLSLMQNDEAPIIKEKHVLSIEEQMEEFMFLGLRMMKGVSVSEFERTFGCPFLSEYRKAVDKYTGLKLLDFDGDTIRLTKAGIDVSNTVMSEFIL